MARNNHPHRDRHDSPPHGNGFHPQVSKGKWTPKPNLSNSNPPPPSRWGLRSQSRASQPIEGAIKDTWRSNRPGPFRIRNPSKVEKSKPSDSRTYHGAGWRPISANEPFSKKRNSGTQKRRDVDEALDNIIHNTRPRTRLQTQLENSQPPNPFNQPISKPSPNPWGKRDVNAPFVADNPFQSSGFGRSQPQPGGYRAPTVEDGIETESDHQGKGRRRILSPSGPLLMEEDNGISPKTGAGKTVHWADNLSGPSSTGQPGLKQTAKPSFSYYPPLPKDPSSSQPVPPPSETPRAETPFVFGVTSGYPTPSPTPPPKTPPVSGLKPHPHTQVPSPPNTPRRSSRFQNTQSTSNLAIDSSLSNRLVQAELEYLHSNLFNPRLLRPVMDLSQIFTSMMGTFGEPGTGLFQSKYTPPSPQLARFRPDFGAGINKNRAPKGRQYSINLSMKSRQIEIELLRARVSHAMLLRFDLADDARHDAINIGDMAQFAVGHDANLPGLSHIRATDLEFGRTSGTGKSTIGSSRTGAGTGIASGRGGSRRRNSDDEAWKWENGTKKRRRESDGDRESERNRRINLQKALARAVEQGNPRAMAEQAWVRGETSTVNMMIWRFVRLSALVETDVKIPGRIGSEKMEEVQSAWWAVPEKAITGWL